MEAHARIQMPRALGPGSRYFDKHATINKFGQWKKKCLQHAYCVVDQPRFVTEAREALQYSTGINQKKNPIDCTWGIFLFDSAKGLVVRFSEWKILVRCGRKKVKNLPLCEPPIFLIFLNIKMWISVSSLPRWRNPTRTRTLELGVCAQRRAKQRPHPLPRRPATTAAATIWFSIPPFDPPGLTRNSTRSALTAPSTTIPTGWSRKYETWKWTQAGNFSTWSNGWATRTNDNSWEPGRQLFPGPAPDSRIPPEIVE